MWECRSAQNWVTATLTHVLPLDTCQSLSPSNLKTELTKWGQVWVHAGLTSLTASIKWLSTAPWNYRSKLTSLQTPVPLPYWGLVAADFPKQLSHCIHVGTPIHGTQMGWWGPFFLARKLIPTHVVHFDVPLLTSWFVWGIPVGLLVIVINYIYIYMTHFIAIPIYQPVQCGKPNHKPSPILPWMGGVWNHPQMHRWFIIGSTTLCQSINYPLIIHYCLLYPHD